MERLKDKEQESDREVKQIDIEEKAVNDRLTMYDHDIASFRQDQTSLSARIDELHTSLQGNQQQANVLEKNIEELAARKHTQQTSKETVQHELTEVKVLLAKKNSSSQISKKNTKECALSLIKPFSVCLKLQMIFLFNE